MFRWIMNKIARVLKRELRVRQERNPNFSMRSFARWLGVSPAHLSQVMSGKRKLTPEKALVIAEAMDLSPLERAEFLRGLFESSPAPNKQNRLHLQLSEDQFRLISDWYHFAILSLTKIPDAKPDPIWIGRRLGITTPQAQVALDRLQRLGIISLTPQFQQVSDPLHVVTDFPSEAIRRYHKQNLKLAEEKVELIPLHLRELQALTVATNPRVLDKLRGLIDEFLNQVSDLLESEPEPSEVYTVSIQAFPISERIK